MVTTQHVYHFTDRKKQTYLLLGALIFHCIRGDLMLLNHCPQD